MFLNTDHKASEIATLMNQEGMEGATAVRAPVVMQPTEGPHKGKFLYRKEPVMTDDGVNPAMVAFGNNAVNIPTPAPPVPACFFIARFPEHGPTPLLSVGAGTFCPPDFP